MTVYADASGLACCTIFFLLN